MRNLDGLPADQLRQAVRQIVGMRHCRAVDKHGNHRDVATEGGLDLDADPRAPIVTALLGLNASVMVPWISRYLSFDREASI